MPDKSYAQQVVTLRTGRDLPELLRELYVDKRHSQGEIAKAIGVSRNTVREWLQDFGISRAERAPVEISRPAEATA